MVAKKEIAILRGLGWFDDRLYPKDSFRSPKGWTPSLGGFSSDGDIASINGEIQADIASLTSEDFGRLIARFRPSQGKSLVKIFTDSTWEIIKELATEEGYVDIPLDLGKTITKIAISSTGGPALVDFIGFATESPIILDEDIEKCSVDETNVLVSGQARFSAFNRNNIFKDVDKGDRVLIWMGKDKKKKVFGGFINNIERKWPERSVDVVVFDIGRTALSREFAEEVPYDYANEKVTMVISAVTYDAVQDGDITLHGVETIDDPSNPGNELAIAIKLSKTTELKAMQDIATTCAESGNQPDMRITPAGDLQFFQSGSKFTGKKLYGGPGGNVISNKFFPISKVINKVVLYTPNMSSLPADRDSFTEVPSNDFQWVGKCNYNDIYEMTGEIGPSAQRYITGGASKYLNGAISDGTGYVLAFWDMLEEYDLTKYVIFHMYYWAAAGIDPSSFQLRIAKEIDADGNSTNYYYRNVSMTTDAWVELEFSTGEDASGWSSTGSPSWDALRYVVLKFTKGGSALDVDFWFDNLYFAKGKAYYSDEDTTSINEHGLEVQTFNREDLMTEDDAEAVMSSLIALYKDPRRNTVTVTKGDTDLIPGWNVELEIPDEELDDYFRITRATHKFDRGVFTTSLNLTVTSTAYWLAPSMDYFGFWRRARKWATLGADILPIWG